MTSYLLPIIYSNTLSCSFLRDRQGQHWDRKKWRFEPGRVCWPQWHWGRFFSECFGVPLLVLSHQCSVFIFHLSAISAVYSYQVAASSSN